MKIDFHRIWMLKTNSITISNDWFFYLQNFSQKYLKITYIIQLDHIINRNRTGRSPIGRNRFIQWHNKVIFKIYVMDPNTKNFQLSIPSQLNLNPNRLNDLQQPITLNILDSQLFHGINRSLFPLYTAKLTEPAPQKTPSIFRATLTLTINYRKVAVNPRTISHKYFRAVSD